MKVWKKIILLASATFLTACASTVRNPIPVEAPPPEGMANVYLFQRPFDQLHRVVTFGLIAIADRYLNVVVSDSEGVRSVPRLGNKTAAIVPVKPGKVEVVVSFAGTNNVKTVNAEAGKNYYFAWNAPSSTNVAGLMLSQVSETNAKHQLRNRSLVNSK